jgi:hypothetical protein
VFRTAYSYRGKSSGEFIDFFNSIYVYSSFWVRICTLKRNSNLAELNSTMELGMGVESRSIGDVSLKPSFFKENGMQKPHLFLWKVPFAKIEIPLNPYISLGL